MDDVAVIATGQDFEALEYEMNNVLETVSEWMDEKGLKLSVQKTEAVVLTSKRGYTQPNFRLRGEGVQIKEQVTYLGVELNKALGFKHHVETAAVNATSMASALATRILPNVGGYKQRTRQLLTSIVHSRLLYAALVWAGSMVFESNIKILE